MTARWARTRRNPERERHVKRNLSAVLVTVVLAGCASSSQPSVVAYPAKGQSAELQAKDSNECQAWAKQQSGYDPATETAKGAGIGAVVGAVLGGVGGAVGGGAYQYSKTKEGHDRAYSACMQGRGYTVK